MRGVQEKLFRVHPLWHPPFPPHLVHRQIVVTQDVSTKGGRVVNAGGHRREGGLAGPGKGWYGLLFLLFLSLFLLLLFVLDYIGAR